DAGRELVTLADLGDLLREEHLDELDLVVQVLDDLLDLALGLAAVLDGDLAPVLVRDLLERLLGDVLALGEQDLPLLVDEPVGDDLPDEELTDLPVGVVADDLDLVVLILEELGLLAVLDLLGALVLLRSLAGEDAGGDDRAGDARRYAQRAVAHVAGLLAEDG